MCGVFGIYAPDRDVARLTHFALHALQHRGQEAAGIAVSENGRLTVLQELGLITNFSEQKLRGLRGEAAIGHTRYSTTGSSTWANAQPLLPRGNRTVALAHNGNLVNANELRSELETEGAKLGSTSDSELIAVAIAGDPRPLEEAVPAAMARLEGAYSVVAIADGKLLAFRDPARLPAARPRPPGRRLGRRLRDMHLRPARRRAGTGGRARRAGDGRRGRAALDPGRARGRRRRTLHLRVLLLLQAGLAPRRRGGARGARADGRAAGRGSRLSTQTSSSPSPTRARPRRSASRERRASRSARA